MCNKFLAKITATECLNVHRSTVYHKYPWPNELFMLVL